MISIRKGVDRGHANHGWLDTNHTFSFANYYHPDHMGFRSLRVINEDKVNPGAGFPPHSHQDMEIITYVLEGAVAHKDSTGGGGVIRPGEVQYMRAGEGVTHSEYNASDSELLHLYQIWLLPKKKGLKAGYAQKSFGDERNGVFRLVASPDGREGSLLINQDSSLYASVLEEGAEIDLPYVPGRYGWLQVARGGVEIGGAIMQAGDGAKIESEESVSVKVLAPDTDLLFFDLV